MTSSLLQIKDLKVRFNQSGGSSDAVKKRQF